MSKWKWDDRYMGLARHVASWSKDPSAKVGAVICDKMGRIISVGYNGLPRNIADLPERLNDRSVKYEMVVHGEVNALIAAHADLTGCILYTWPFHPCSRCAAMFIQAGILRVVAPPLPVDYVHWKKNIELAKEMFAEAGVISEEWYNESTNPVPTQQPEGEPLAL